MALSSPSAALSLRAPRVRLIETARGRELAELAAPKFEPALANLRDGWYGRPAFVVNTRARHQTFLGFGGAFTESAAFVLGHLDDAQQDAVLKGYFDAAEGHGYVFGRTHINSCDFSLGNWACADVPGDLALEHFSIERTARHVAPMIRRALRAFAASPPSPAAPSLRLLASPWSPPAWMKLPAWGQQSMLLSDAPNCLMPSMQVGGRVTGPALSWHWRPTSLPPRSPAPPSG